MDEQATFETRAVLESERARLSRLALLVPVLALVAIAWAGVSGARPDQATAELPDPTAVAAPSVRPQRPAQVLGIDVQRLDNLQPRTLRRDRVIAVGGWYVATAITDCPPLAAIYRDGALPEVRDDIDHLAFCDRSGVLYASRPNLDHSLPMNDFEENRSKNAGLPAVAVTLVIGVIVPPELEMVGADATEVVVIGRFVESGDACDVPIDCHREFVVDHLGWPPRA